MINKTHSEHYESACPPNSRHSSGRCFSSFRAISVRGHVSSIIDRTVPKERPSGGGLSETLLVCWSGRRSLSASLQKRQQVGIDRVSVRGRHPVREVLVGLQRPVP